MGNQLRGTEGNLEGGGSRDSKDDASLGVDWNTESDTLSVDARDIVDKTTGPQLRDNCFKRLHGSTTP